MLDRRTFLTATAAGVALPLTSASTSAAPRATRVLARDLEVPWGLAFLPDGDALVTERISGRVQRVHKAGGRRLVGVISRGADRGEGGLLGVAVALTFAEDRWVYFYLTTKVDNRVIRKKLEGGRLGRTHVLLAGIPAARNHNGGRLAFG